MLREELSGAPDTLVDFHTAVDGLERVLLHLVDVAPEAHLLQKPHAGVLAVRREGRVACVGINQ